jgi:hypothetical protein
VTGITDLIAPALIARNVNAMVAQTNGVVALSILDNLGFDFSYTYIPEVTNSQIDFYVNGTIFNASNGEISPNVGFADLFVNKTTTGTIQLDVSAYTADSLLLTLQQGKWL